VEKLCGIVRLAHEWEMFDHVASAVILLAARPTSTGAGLEPDSAPPAWDMWYKMALGALIKDRDWVEEALRDIVKLSAEEWRLSPHRFRVDPYVLCEITALLKDIDEHRRIGAWSAPSLVHGLSCGSRARCRDGWAVAWSEVLGGQMLHPRHPISDAGVLSLLRNTDIQDVCIGCAFATYDKLQTRPAYRMEEYFFQRCVCNILGLTPPGKQAPVVACGIHLIEIHREAHGRDKPWDYAITAN
jgi:hypothetical protein